MPNILDIIEEKQNNHIKISLSGELDIYTCEEFRKKIYDVIDNNTLDLKFDLENLSYIDSTGLGILVGALKASKKNVNSIYIYNLKERIKKLFVITGLDKLFVIEEWKNE